MRRCEGADSCKGAACARIDAGARTSAPSKQFILPPPSSLQAARPGRGCGQRVRARITCALILRICTLFFLLLVCIAVCRGRSDGLGSLSLLVSDRGGLQSAALALVASQSRAVPSSLRATRSHQRLEVRVGASCIHRGGAESGESGGQRQQHAAIRMAHSAAGGRSCSTRRRSSSRSGRSRSVQSRIGSCQCCRRSCG